jgi:hypothetical protein
MTTRASRHTPEDERLSGTGSVASDGRVQGRREFGGVRDPDTWK